MVIRTYSRIGARPSKGGWCVADLDTGEVIEETDTRQLAEEYARQLRALIDEGEDLESAKDAIAAGGLEDPPMWSDEEARDLERQVLVSEYDGMCLCGCAGRPKKKSSRFLPGHDGRLKGDLMQLARSGNQWAVAKLDSFGWLKFLTPTAAERARAVAEEERKAGLGDHHATNPGHDCREQTRNPQDVGDTR